MHRSLFCTPLRYALYWNTTAFTCRLAATFIEAQNAVQEFGGNTAAKVSRQPQCLSALLVLYCKSLYNVLKDNLLHICISFTLVIISCHSH